MWIKSERPQLCAETAADVPQDTIPLMAGALKITVFFKDDVMVFGEPYLRAFFLD